MNQDIETIDKYENRTVVQRNKCRPIYEVIDEDYIAQARTDRCNIMCYLVAHNGLKTDYKDNESIIDDRAITNDATVRELK